MDFHLLRFLLVVLFNLIAYFALREAATQWIRPESRRKAVRVVGLVVFLLSLPLLFFFIRGTNISLDSVPSWALKIFFYPATAWLATIIAFFLIAAPSAVVWTVGKTLAVLIRKGKHLLSATPPRPPQEAPALSRRRFLAGSAGLLIPSIYGVAAYGVYGGTHEIDISEQVSIPIPYLPRSLEGLTIVQLSDLHVGPYIREKELRHIVSLTNNLRPDLVVITGDLLDRYLSSLPAAVRGLKGIQSSLGVFAVLGNHDYYAARNSSLQMNRGIIQITKGLESVGIQTLRNQTVHLGSGQERLALLGLDWLDRTPGSRGFFRYKPVETREHLHRMVQEAGPETPQVLLAHHPHTFMEAAPLEIGLTLAGHTHGGGQVIVGNIDGVPIGLGTIRFLYLSGLYRESSCSLYVNRGIGYLGIPIRINCPPEISRFRLIRPTPPGNGSRELSEGKAGESDPSQ